MIPSRLEKRNLYRSSSEERKACFTTSPMPHMNSLSGREERVEREMMISEAGWKAPTVFFVFLKSMAAFPPKVASTMARRVVGQSIRPAPLMYKAEARAVMSHTTPPPRAMKIPSLPMPLSRAKDRMRSRLSQFLWSSPLSRTTVLSGDGE